MDTELSPILKLHLASLREDSIVGKWENSGLLNGLGYMDKFQLCRFFEACANYMIIDDNMIKLNVGSYKFEYDLQMHMFPILRRLYMTNKLSYVHFLEKTEIDNYTKTVMAYVNDIEPVLVYDIYNDIKDFIPKLIRDYLEYNQLPRIKQQKLDLSMPKGIDIEAEILSQYTGEFDITKLQHLINSPFRIQ
jgi:hypothetical protein